MNYAEESLKQHYIWKGKVEVASKAHVDSKQALSIAYTPSVAQPCLESQKDPDKSFELTARGNMVALLSGSFGGSNLEDISAPRCFEIERRLKERCDIPIFHDDQHGTAVVTLVGLINALKLVGKGWTRSASPSAARAPPASPLSAC